MTADEYLREVECALRDLPWQQRRDLVADLRRHLAELPADSDLSSRLGSPAQYASDLRAAEGLERRRGLRAYLRARRPRNLIVVTLLLVMLSLAIGLTIGVVAYVDSYQPLTWGGLMAEPNGARPSPGQAGDTVEFRKGAPFRYGISLANNGRYAVRVLGVPRDVTDFFAGHLLMSTDKGFNTGTLIPFHPFDMRPGSYRLLIFKGVFRCTTGMSRSPGGVTHHAFPVRYSFHWRTATASIPLTDPLEISFAKEGCPSKR